MWTAFCQKQGADCHANDERYRGQILLCPHERESCCSRRCSREKGEFRDVVERLGREGFVRARIDGELVELTNGVRIKLDPKEKHTIEAVVDRW